MILDELKKNIETPFDILQHYSTVFHTAPTVCVYDPYQNAFAEREYINFSQYANYARSIDRYSDKEFAVMSGMYKNGQIHHACMFDTDSISEDEFDHFVESLICFSNAINEEDVYVAIFDTKFGHHCYLLNVLFENIEYVIAELIKHCWQWMDVRYMAQCLSAGSFQLRISNTVKNSPIELNRIIKI